MIWLVEVQSCEDCGSCQHSNEICQKRDRVFVCDRLLIQQTKITSDAKYSPGFFLETKCTGDAYGSSVGSITPILSNFWSLDFKTSSFSGSSGELWSTRAGLRFECDEAFGVWWGDETCPPQKLMGTARIIFPKTIQLELWGSFDAAQKSPRVVEDMLCVLFFSCFLGRVIKRSCGFSEIWKCSKKSNPMMAWEVAAIRKFQVNSTDNPKVTLRVIRSYVAIWLPLAAER